MLRGQADTLAPLLVAPGTEAREALRDRVAALDARRNKEALGQAAEGEPPGNSVI